MNTITVKNTDEISNLFKFEDINGEEQQAFLREVGTLVFQSALMRHLAVLGDSEGQEFDVFIEKHVADENFMELLCAEYSDFENIFMEEMMAFRSEFVAK